MDKVEAVSQNNLSQNSGILISSSSVKWSDWILSSKDVVSASYTTAKGGSSQHEITITDWAVAKRSPVLSPILATPDSRWLFSIERQRDEKRASLEASRGACQMSRFLLAWGWPNGIWVSGEGYRWTLRALLVLHLWRILALGPAMNLKTS